MDTAYFFNVFMREKIDHNSEAARGLGQVYSFVIEGAGSWHIDLSTEPATIAEGELVDCECRLSATKEDFEIAINHPREIIRLVMKGRIALSNTTAFQALMRL